MEARAVKWWGWEWEDKVVSLDGRPGLLECLREQRERLNLDSAARRNVDGFECINATPSLLSSYDLGEVGPAAGLP